MPWSTRLSKEGWNYYDDYSTGRYACSVPDSLTNTVVITGGGFDENSSKLVTRYSLQGFVEDLPQLGEGRFDHGCGTYQRSDGTQVTRKYLSRSAKTPVRLCLVCLIFN